MKMHGPKNKIKFFNYISYTEEFDIKIARNEM